MSDEFNLQRFVDAQDGGGTYMRALNELRNGRKQSHWMWFVFPQIVGLGSSPASQHYAITGLEEARAYLADATLGPRLLECVEAILTLEETDPTRVFGSIDAQKLRSSMTLFAAAEPAEAAFSQVLDKYFAGDHDPATTSRL